MKKLLLVFVLTLSFAFSFAQNQKRIIFQFEKGKDITIQNENYKIYKLNKNNTFQYIQGKHEKKKVDYNSIKDNIISYQSFIENNSNKKFPEFFNEYSFFIYEKETDIEGCLIEVEKVWLVEEKIID